MSAGVIEVRINEFAQLFNSLDPSPFHQRDRDDEAEDYIVSWARELSAMAMLATGGGFLVGELVLSRILF